MPYFLLNNTEEKQINNDRNIGYTLSVKRGGQYGEKH